MNETVRYRQADYEPVPAWRRWWPLAVQEFSSLFRTRWGVALYCLCLVPGFGRLVMLLIIFGVVNFGPPGLRSRLSQRSEMAQLDPRQVEFYLEPVLAVMPGMVFCLLLTSLVVARAVARDRVTNALELYWTRSVSPAAYLFAKFCGCFLLMAVLTTGVPLALWITAVLLADDWSLFLASAPQIGCGLGGLLLVTAIWTAMCILISAACTTPNTAMVLWSMLLVGSSAAGFVLSKVLQEPRLRACLSVWDAGGVVVRAIAGVSERGVSVAWALATLTGLLIGLLLLAARRLRLVEAIG